MVPDTQGRWHARYTTEALAIWLGERGSPGWAALRETVDRAARRPGQVILGTPFRDQQDSAMSVVALHTTTDRHPGTVVGLLNYSTLIEGLYAIQVPTGLNLRLSGSFRRGSKVDLPIWGTPNATALHRVTSRALRGQSEIDVVWELDEAFAGGPSTGLAWLGFCRRRRTNAACHLFIAVLVQRNQTIALKVREAVEALRESQERFELAVHGSGDALSVRPDAFDCVLLDIQMPVMDGYAATREIRGKLQIRGLPVITMTANAMSGDLEKTLEAGMNDHVAKPIDIKHLFNVLRRWIEVPEVRRSEEPLRVSIPNADARAITAADEGLAAIPGIDTTTGLARVGGSAAVYRKILDKFRQIQADAPHRIRVALAAGDPTTAEREAHTLKGAAGNIGADAVQAAAKAVEDLIRDGANSRAALHALEQALGTLIRGMAPPQQPEPREHEPATAVSTDDLIPLLDRLRALLEDDDAEAIDVVEQIEPRLEDETLRDAFREINRHIDDFEFDGALERLNTLRQAIQPSSHLEADPY